MCYLYMASILMLKTENPELLMTLSMMIFCCHKRSNTSFFMAAILT